MRGVRKGWIAAAMVAVLVVFSAAVALRYQRYQKETQKIAQELERADTEEKQVSRLTIMKPEGELEEPEIVIKREEADLPDFFDYREEERRANVKNQGQYGTCWAFASLTALETALLPEEKLEFSPDHLSIQNSFSLEQDQGGSYIMAAAYLTGWQGPVLEKDDPYGDNRSPEGLKPVKHVQEVRILGAKDYQGIKQTVYLHGGVETSLYVDVESADEESAYYQKANASYCYEGEKEPNHDVVIIGWDDRYPAENFKNIPEGDGAFICQNSWGSGFGEDGVFYVSYYDKNIGSYNVAYTRVEEPDNYDLIYQTDLCGWTGQIGYNTDTAYFANVYEADSAQTIRAVGFYATTEETEYAVCVIPDFQGEASLENLKFSQTGYLQYSGFYTIDLTEGVSVEPGSRFAVAVRITSKNTVYPIAVEYSSSMLGDAVTLEDGEGYISPHGKRWERSEEKQNSNVCLKAYADRL